MAWNEAQACNRIIRKLGPKHCAAAYQLHIEHGMDAQAIGKALAISPQSAGSAIRAGRLMNELGLFDQSSLTYADACSLIHAARLAGHDQGRVGPLSRADCFYILACRHAESRRAGWVPESLKRSA